MGDARTADLQRQELYYVVPLVGMIEQVLKLLEEARVAAVLVLPLWVGREWSLWLRERAEQIEKLPWRSYPAVWLDVADKGPKKHVLASQWEFMVVAVDWREGAQVKEHMCTIPRRWIDLQPLQAFQGKLIARWAAETKPGGCGYPRRSWVRRKPHAKQLWPVAAAPRRLPRPGGRLVFLSLCGGVATLALAAQRVVDVFELGLTVEVHEVENHEWARKIGKKLAGARVVHEEPHDVWEWVRDEAELEARLRSWGQLDGYVMGYSCQDVSTAFKTGQGLQGGKSSVFFPGRGTGRSPRAATLCRAGVATR